MGYRKQNKMKDAGNRKHAVGHMMQDKGHSIKDTSYRKNTEYMIKDQEYRKNTEYIIKDKEYRIKYTGYSI